MAKDAEAYNKKHGKQEGKKWLRCGSPWIAHQAC